VATVELSVPGAWLATGFASSETILLPRFDKLNFAGRAPRTTSQKQALISTKLNEARIAREFSLYCRDQSVRRLSDAVGNSQWQYVDDWTTARRGAPVPRKPLPQVMQLAAKEDLTVVPAGGSHIGSTRDNPKDPGRFDYQHAPHDPAHSSRACRFGGNRRGRLTLSALQKQLGSTGQWLPIDPPDDGRATLAGGSLPVWAAHTVSASALRGHFVYGMKVVLADGRAIKAGGSVVKNVAGS